MNKPKLFLLDSFALIFRAYYAFINNPRINSKQMNTSAAFGYTNALIDIINTNKPEYIAAVFDSPGPTFRNELYSEYKANRDATPEDIKRSIPHIKRILKALNIPIIEASGFEADDIIGTLAKKAAQNNFSVFMVTPDKDYCQLVEENIVMYKPAKGGNEVEIVGVEKVQELFKVERAEQVIDVLALWGDASDNIPGAPGIGEKTSKEIIAQYGSLEGIYENINDFKGKKKENLIEFKERIMLARKLVTIDLNVPLDIDFEAMKLTPANQMELNAVLEELEFKNMLKRMQFGEKPAVAVQTDLFGNIISQPETAKGNELENLHKTIADTPHNYMVCSTDGEIEALVTQLLNAAEFCFDTETTGLDTMTAELVGMSFALKPFEAYYVPVSANRLEAVALIEKFRSVFENENSLKIAQNIKYDMGMLLQYGIEVKGELFDTMLAHYLVEPDSKHGMDFLSKKYLNYEPVSIEALIGSKTGAQRSMRTIALDRIKEYAAEDADVTLQLKYILAKELEKSDLNKVFKTIEMPLVRVLLAMEQQGIAINTVELNAFAERLRLRIIEIEKSIIADAGYEFNVSSPKQLGEILFDRMKIIPNAKKTKTQQYATSEDELQKIADKHPIINKILDYRELRKLLNTYVEVLPKLIHPTTGRIHTSFNQAVAATGRLSSSDPNLQNIPVRTADGREIRKAFVPVSDEYLLLSADYSQIELRLMAHLSKDESMLEAFVQGKDIHTATAAKIYGIPESEVTKDMRSKAKSANFGIIYGISSFGLARNLNILVSEAKQLIDSYFASYPGVKTYMDTAIAEARNNAFVSTLFGRRRYLADINSSNGVVRGVAERNAINAPIQGSAADIIKLAMIELYNQIKIRNLKSNLVLQVHDELLLNVHKSEIDLVKPLVKECMENAAKLSVKLTVEADVAENWLDAH